MEFKIIEGNVNLIQSELNLLSEDYDIQIKGVSSSQIDTQLGCGGIVVLFTIEKHLILKPLKEIEIKKEMNPDEILKQLQTKEGEKIIYNIVNKCVTNTAKEIVKSPVKQPVKQKKIKTNKKEK